MIAPYFYRDNELSVEEVTLADIAEKEGTPCYVYSSAAILSQYRAYDQAFGTAPHQVCFAVKANSNLSILRMLAEAGAGFDIVSGGELFRVLRAGGDPAKVVFHEETWLDRGYHGAPEGDLKTGDKRLDRIKISFTKSKYV